LAVAALRLANATILPYDYERFGGEMAAIVEGLLEDEGRTDDERKTLLELVGAFSSMEAAGRTLNTARAAALENGLKKAQAEEANGHLRKVERALTREEGLVGRPWFKNLMFAADYDNGYATIALPTVQEALKAGDAGRVIREARDLTARVAEANRAIIAAMGAMN